MLNGGSPSGTDWVVCSLRVRGLLLLCSVVLNKPCTEKDLCDFNTSGAKGPGVAGAVELLISLLIILVVSIQVKTNTALPRMVNSEE